MAIYDALEYRVGKFQELGFEYTDALALAMSTDRNGVPVYHGDVEKALSGGLNPGKALDLFVNDDGVKA